MPDPITLPPELFTDIIAYALQPSNTDPTSNQNRDVEREYDFYSGTNISHLSQLTLINWQWHVSLLPILYARYSHNGARHSYTSLWQFVRTIISNSRIAQLVHAVNIGNWGFYPDVLADDEGVRGDNVEFRSGEVEMMRRAMRGVFPRGHERFDVLEARILDPKALVERDCRPLVVVLLICLSNVESVWLHLPEECSVLRCVFEELLRCQEEDGELPCLRHLANLHLLAEVPVYGPEAGASSWVSDPALRLDNVWPCIYFSGLRTLALFDLETEGIAALLAKGNGQICQVETLRIVVKATPTRSSVDVQALVNLPQSLTRFSIYWDHNLRSGGPAPGILVPELWDALQKYQESLEYLAIFYNVHELDEPPPGHFGSLQIFPRLKRLDTQLNILLDGMTTERFAPFRLKDTIPENLDTLVLHPSWVYETSPNFQTTEIQAMLTERSRPLRLLALGDFLAAPYYYRVKHLEETGDYKGIDAAGSEPYPGLRALCKQAGTHLHVSSSRSRTCLPAPCEFHKGGACQWLWRKTWNIRLDGIQRNRSSVEQLPKETPRKKIKKTRSIPTHTVTFTDHTGREAFMVFNNGVNTESSKLPPLFSFVVYFTHPDSSPSPEATNLAGLRRAIGESKINSDFHFRLDIYFLPGASEDDCKAHYLAERGSRPDYETVIREFNAREFGLQSTSSSGNVIIPSNSPHVHRLPGMAHSHPDLEPYRGLLLICPEANWRDGAQRISCVKFDKRAMEDMTADGENGDGNEDQVYSEEYRDAPESITLSFRIAYDSPKSDDDDEDILGDWLCQSTKAIQYAHQFGNIYSWAVRLGRTSW